MIIYINHADHPYRYKVIIMISKVFIAIEAIPEEKK